MEALGKLWDVVAAHWVLVLLVLLAVGGVVAFVWWRRTHPPKRVPETGDSKPMPSNRLLQARQAFLGGMEFVKRAAVRELPTVVVLGPLQAGKTELIRLDADFEAQKHQFLPSYVDDELLQLYAGPNTVLQEVSQKLLEDETPEARRALQRLWKACFPRDQRGLAVITLRVDWLVNTEPDKQKRIAQLLRGKLNLISEASRVPVETRICVTHLDTLPGFTSFADLVHENGGSLTFKLPRSSSTRLDATELQALEKQLVDLLESQERYLALGLTTLNVDDFGKLERFFSQSGRAFAALASFVTVLREGNVLSLPPDFTQLYLSFKPTGSTARARPVGALSLSTTEQDAQEQRKRYLRKHLRNCAVAAAICCLPVLAAHGNFYLRLRNAEERMARFGEEVGALPAYQDPAIFEAKELEAGQSMDAVWKAMRYWPLLKYSHVQRVDQLQGNLAAGVRRAHLKPVLELCGKAPASCRPEQVVHLLAILYASREEDLGKLVLRDSRSRHHWEWAASDGDAPLADAPPNWISILGLNESLVEDYVRSSKTPWTASPVSAEDWARWPFTRPVSREAQLEPWLSHLQQLQLVMNAQSREELTKLEAMRPGRQALQDTLDDTVLLGDSLKRIRPYVDKLFEAMPPNTRRPAREELDSIQQSLDWVNDNRQMLTAALRMEEDAYQGWKAVEKLSPAALLTRDGLWDVSGGEGKVTVPKPAPSDTQSPPAPGPTPPAEAPPLPVAQKPALPAAPTQLDVRPAGYKVPDAPEPSPRVSVKVAQNQFDFAPQEHSRELMRMLIKEYMDKAKEEPTEGTDPEAPEAPALTEAEAEKRLLDLGFEFYNQHKPLVDEFARLMQNAQLPATEAPQRQEHVHQQVEKFALRYREALFGRVSAYDFAPPTSSSPARARLELANAMAELTQPSSKLVDMLRSVSTRARLEGVDGPYYEPVRNAVSAFQPIVQLMSQDKGGNYAALDAYRLLLARFLDELNASKAPAAKGAKAKESKEAKESKDDKGTAEEKSDKGDKGDKAEPAESDGPPQLSEKLSPLGRLALSMLMEEKGSYLREVDAWLDAQGLIGPMRVPFRKPFEVARDLGKQELQDLLQREWTEVVSQKLWPLLERYPFRPEALEEVEPSQLEALRRKDGSFWQFVDRMLAPVAEERGTQWALRGPLRGRLALPRKMLTTLGRVSELSRILWDEEGRSRPLMLQVMPQPLPPSPVPGRFITMATLKCGKTTASSYNQAPSWQDFPVTWWSQPTASLSLEQRSPRKDEMQYSSLEKSSSWSCFRLLESAAAVSTDQLRTWRLRRRGDDATKPAVEINFRVRGEPWAPFREVVR